MHHHVYICGHIMQISTMHNITYVLIAFCSIAESLERHRCDEPSQTPRPGIYITILCQPGGRSPGPMTWPSGPLQTTREPGSAVGPRTSAQDVSGLRAVRSVTAAAAVSVTAVTGRLPTATSRGAVR